MFINYVELQGLSETKLAKKVARGESLRWTPEGFPAGTKEFFYGENLGSACPHSCRGFLCPPKHAPGFFRS